jgi:hypothetical protein
LGEKSGKLAWAPVQTLLLRPNSDFLLLRSAHIMQRPLINKENTKKRIKRSANSVGDAGSLSGKTSGDILL